MDKEERKRLDRQVKQIRFCLNEQEDLLKPLKSLAIQHGMGGLCDKMDDEIGKIRDLTAYM